MIAIKPRPAPSRNDAPVVSVVVPTFHRDDLLRRLLERLLAQRLPDDEYEIIVVDDARSETTAQIVGVAANAQPNVVVRALRGQSRGPAAARNIGWRAARGSIIGFIDDDAYPADENWLDTMLRRFEDAAIDGVGGSVSVPLEGRPTDFQANIRRLERSTFVTCNAFYRKSALERVGGFDERFALPFREDSDLQFSIEATGGRLVQEPGAVVVHPAPRGHFGASLRLQRYTMFNALLYKKHPQRFRRELDGGPRLHYYAMALALAGAFVAVVRRQRAAARICMSVWLALQANFCAARLRGTSRRPRDVAEIIVTSPLIPLLSIYWRLRGAIRFRVWFC